MPESELFTHIRQSAKGTWEGMGRRQVRVPHRVHMLSQGPVTHTSSEPHTPLGNGQIMPISQISPRLTTELIRPQSHILSEALVCVTSRHGTC